MTNEHTDLKESDQLVKTQITPQSVLHESLPQLKAALASCQKWISYSSPEYSRFSTIFFWAMLSAAALFMSLTAFVWPPAAADMESIKHWCFMLWWGLWVAGFVWKYFQLPKGWSANSPVAAEVARHRRGIAFFLVICVYFASLEWLDGTGSEPLHIIMGVLIVWFSGLVRHWSHDSKLLSALLHFTNQSDRLEAMESDETGIDPARLLAASLQDVIGELESVKEEN